VNYRKEIAANLRHSADYPRDWMRKVDPRLGMAHNALYEIMHETRCFDTNSCVSLPMLFRRISELIDPTCKPVITVESLTESLTKYTSECSECGAIFGDFPTREQAETTHPTYCQCCGSRVISNDSGKE
jgi:DNA-directed RNA polymerase subunit RPC12/RpoP